MYCSNWCDLLERLQYMKISDKTLIEHTQNIFKNNLTIFILIKNLPECPLMLLIILPIIETYGNCFNNFQHFKIYPNFSYSSSCLEGL